MQQHLLTDVYGLIFLLLIVGAIIRWFRRQSKRTSTKAVWTGTWRTTRWYLFRLGVTSVAAFAFATAVADDSRALVWVILWVGLYWLWKLWDRWHGRGVATPVHKATSKTLIVPEPQALKAARHNRSGGGSSGKQ